MRSILRGSIKDFVPFFRASAGKNKNLIIHVKGNFSLTVDTGFSGGIALPLKVIKKMGMTVAFYDTFRLATGEVVELPVFLGNAKVGRRQIETWFIPGDSLLGLEFLSSAGSFLSLDFDKREVRLDEKR